VEATSRSSFSAPEQTECLGVHSVSNEVQSQSFKTDYFLTLLSRNSGSGLGYLLHDRDNRFGRLIVKLAKVILVELQKAMIPWIMFCCSPYPESPPGWAQ